MSVKLISLISTLIIAGITIPLLLSRIKMMSLKYHSLNFEHYEKLRKLCGRDAKNNLSGLLVALNGVTKSELEPKFIEWFLYSPGAYAYIKRFGNCTKYLTIDTDNNKFIWCEKFDQSYFRNRERLSIFLMYTLSGTVGIVPLLSYELVLQYLGFIPTIFIFIFCSLLLFLALILLSSLTKIDDAASLTKVTIYAGN